MSDEKRYRLEAKEVGTERTVDVLGMTLPATELGKLLVVKVPDEIIGNRAHLEDILAELEHATQEAGSYIVLAPASQPLELYAVEVPAAMKEG